MTRIPPVTVRSDVSPEYQHLFDRMLEGTQQVEVPGELRGPMTILMHSPQVADLARELGSYLRMGSTLTRPESELAIITAAREAKCEYVWGVHMVAARREGLREEAIAVIRDRLDPASLEPEETAIVQYVQQLIRSNRVEQSVFDFLLDCHNAKWLVELTVLVGHYGLLAGVLNAFEVPARADAEQLPSG
jgi:4-carboxymuconolactone decarboxylase